MIALRAHGLPQLLVGVVVLAGALPSLRSPAAEPVETVDVSQLEAPSDPDPPAPLELDEDRFEAPARSDAEARSNAAARQQAIDDASRVGFLCGCMELFASAELGIIVIDQLGHLWNELTPAE